MSKVVKKPFIIVMRAVAGVALFFATTLFGIMAAGATEASPRAYQETVVSNGGTLTGRVILAGALHAPRAFKASLAPFSDFCQKIANSKGVVELQEYTVDNTGGMQDVIVAVRNVTSGKPFAPITTRLIASDCMFHPAEVSHHAMYETDTHGSVRHLHPLVTVFEESQVFSVINRDPIFHNAQVYQKETGHIVLNIPMPALQNDPMNGTLRFERRGKTAQVVCGMHPYMQTFGMIVNNPYYAKTDRQGGFAIDQLPPGTYTVSVWHPRFKTIEKEVTVSAHEKATLNVEFQASNARQHIFESAESIRH